jgi:exodeoxyribonuclease VII small subunit
MPDSPSEDLTFEQGLERLEEIVRELENNQTGLERALALYEAGIGLLRRCRSQLERVEQRIFQLTGQDEEGQPTLSLFEHGPAVESEAVETRRKRKRPTRGESKDEEIPF